MYGVENIVTGRSRYLHIAWMPPYADTSLSVTAELKEVFNNLKIQGEFDMERIEAEDLTADSDKYVVKVNWVGLGGNNLGAGVYYLRRCAEVRSGPAAEAEVDEEKSATISRKSMI